MRAKKKKDIRNWLDEHNMQYDDKDIKKTLLDRVRQHRTEKLCLIDDAAHQHGHGHTVLSLLVAHCELNPIELAWASVKGYVVKHVAIFHFKRSWACVGKTSIIEHTFAKTIGSDVLLSL